MDHGHRPPEHRQGARPGRYRAPAVPAVERARPGRGRAARRRRRDQRVAGRGAGRERADRERADRERADRERTRRATRGAARRGALTPLWRPSGARHSARGRSTREQALEWPPEHTLEARHVGSALRTLATRSAEAPDDPGDLCVMPYTSGTTGRPKGCMHTHRSVMYNVVAGQQWFGITQDATALAVLPFFHVTGMQGSMNGPLYTGGTVVLLPRRDRVVAAQLIERYRVTSWTAIPTVVIDLLANPSLDPRALASLQRMSGGGAADRRPRRVIPEAAAWDSHATPADRSAGQRAASSAPGSSCARTRGDSHRTRSTTALQGGGDERASWRYARLSRQAVPAGRAAAGGLLRADRAASAPARQRLPGQSRLRRELGDRRRLVVPGRVGRPVGRPLAGHLAQPLPVRRRARLRHLVQRHRARISPGRR
ncbi:MAG: AMP-binding protein [Gammaproteobacteria bacterium]|nr:AMP-binding protein [Gammaproteobacteria bacterium]